ncbi:MAG: hypothetical protein J6F31_04685 [Oscillospiraceae bacterium]|nr:hypothetical protein [Oscillospiraceae bacterium]
MKMRLTLDMDNISYASIIRMILPYIKKEDIPAILLPVIDRAGEPGVLENFLKLVPKKTQDDIVISIVNKNRSRIIRQGKGLMDRFGIDGELVDMKLQRLVPKPRTEVKKP